jgi:prophage endopeptidase
MNGYFITGIAAVLLGAAIGAGTTHELDANHYGALLSTEQAAHARDNEQHAKALKAVSDAALDAEQNAIQNQKVALGQIFTLDAQITQEKTAHEADNAKNRAAIADGTRRLRIAVTNYTPTPSGSGSTGTGSSPGSVGDGAGGTAELPPAFGSALFTIVDDADNDARAKVEYLQRFICVAQRQGVVAGTCQEQ